MKEDHSFDGTGSENQYIKGLFQLSANRPQIFLWKYMPSANRQKILEGLNTFYKSTKQRFILKSLGQDKAEFKNRNNYQWITSLIFRYQLSQRNWQCDSVLKQTLRMAHHSVAKRLGTSEMFYWCSWHRKI